MSSFNWETEEDGGWGDAQPIIQEQPDLEGGRKWLPFLLAILGIILVSGLLYWQIRGRIGGAEDVRNEDIVAVNKLLVYAADRKDSSVLISILPLENGPWTGIQRALASDGLLLDRWPLGIHRNGEEPVIKDIVLSPDLQEADVTIEIPYQVQNQGKVETIYLQQTHNYQFRNEWRWMEPDTDYWGGAGQEVYEGRGNNGLIVGDTNVDAGNITALYPMRDEEIVKRVVDDLPGFLIGLCEENNTINCRRTIQFVIMFEREPGIWKDIAARIEENGSYIPRFLPSAIRNGMIVLPTPSLVGKPVDEAGYQALLRGYASHVFSAVFADIYGEECCPEDLTYPLFLEGEMAKRGLGFWPPPTLEKEIASKRSNGELPDRDIALLCTSPERDRLQFFRYELATGQLWTELANRQFARIRSAPNGLGVIAQEVEEVSEDERLTRIIYWYDNTARILYEETLPETVLAASNWQVLEDEQRLLLVIPDLDSRVTTFIQVDLANCANGNCPLSAQELTGSPTWSPDGNQFLIKSGNILWWRQLVGDSIEQEPLGLGTAPFWLDNNTFGFVRTGENRFQEIVTSAAGDPEMTVILDSERLRLLLGEENKPEQLMIGYVGLDPIISGDELTNWTILGFEWFSNGSLGEAFIFSYDIEVDSLTVMLQSDQLHSFNLSPDGRFLAAGLYDETLDSWRVKIEPVADGQETTLLPWQAKDEEAPLRYDWTADSQWLLVLNQGILTLYNPQTQITQLAPPPLPGCVQAAWMN